MNPRGRIELNHRITCIQRIPNKNKIIIAFGIVLARPIELYSPVNKLNGGTSRQRRKIFCAVAVETY